MFRFGRSYRRTLAIFTGLCVVTACRPNDRSDAEAVAAIAAAREAFWAAHGQGNAQALADLVTEDAILFAPGAEAIEGRDAIRAAAEGMFAALTVTDLRIESTDLQVHRPLAYELATYSETLTPKGGQPSPARGRYLIVWRQGADGRWRVHRNMFHFISGGH